MRTPSPAGEAPPTPASAPVVRRPRLLIKEWAKLRLPAALLLAAGTAWALYLVLRVRQLYAIYDAEAIWHAWLTKGLLFLSPYQYVPLAIGVLIGVLQFLPEIQRARIRLALHLPLDEDRLVLHHLGLGLGAITLLWVPAAVLFTGMATIYFPAEYLGHLLAWLAQIVLAGYAAYLLIAAGFLEPAWPVRIVYLLIALGALPMYFAGEFYDAHLRILPVITAWTAALILLPVVACRRYREGA